MNVAEMMNKEQLEAVKHKDGPLLILAGAGSGKTRVITYRIANLISEYGVDPANILAVTFTNKAAQEMKSRIKKAVGKNANKITTSTFHSLGCRMLRAHAEKLGYTKSFSIYDEDYRERLIKECMHDAKVSDKEMRPYDIIKRISSIKNELIGPVEFEAKYAEDYESKAISRVYTISERKLKNNNAIDFDDLIVKPIELLKNNKEVLESYRELYRYILIDEYQDINNSQYTLVSMLAEKYKNICVVGDDDQSIYRFRGADITNILDFEKDYKDAKVIRLEQNYRSTKTILKAAHAVIKNNVDRKGKELWTENDAGEKITFYYADDEVMESEAIIKEIYRIINTQDAHLKDMAVFYRTNAQSRVVEDRFRRAGVRYKLVGGLSFYARMEIKDMLAYLRVISNPRDIMSFKRVINVPPRGIGETTVDKLEQFAFKNDLSFLEALEKSEAMEDIKGTAKTTLKAFHDFIKFLHDNKEVLSLKEITEKIITGTGYIDYWQEDPSPKAKERVENVKELVSAMAEYEEGKKDTPATLDDFLQQVAMMSDMDKLDESAEAVTLMTIHSAKGLEFDYVFITGMEEGIFPHKNCLEEPGGIEEERRLAYVAITRARKKLYIMSAVSRRQLGTKKICKISRFVDEIPEEILDRKGRLPVKQTQEKFYGNGPDEEPVCPALDSTPVYNDEPQESMYLAGQKVKHAKLGQGTILKTEPYGDDLKITVLFRNCGKKVLSAKFAGLEKI
jgi:DNA helicase-2/ATP-dependent DNA helicase PcrA